MLISRFKMGDSEDDFELPNLVYTPISSLEQFQQPKLKHTVKAKKQQKPAKKKLTKSKKILGTKQNCYQIPENNFLARAQSKPSVFSLGVKTKSSIDIAIEGDNENTIKIPKLAGTRRPTEVKIDPRVSSVVTAVEVHHEEPNGALTSSVTVEPRRTPPDENITPSGSTTNDTSCSHHLKSRYPKQCQDEASFESESDTDDSFCDPEWKNDAEIGSDSSDSDDSKSNSNDDDASKMPPTISNLHKDLPLRGNTREGSPGEVPSVSFTRRDLLEYEGSTMLDRPPASQTCSPRPPFASGSNSSSQGINLVRGLMSAKHVACLDKPGVRPPPESSTTLDAVDQGLPAPKTGGLETNETLNEKQILLCIKCSKKFISLGPHKRHEESCGKTIHKCNICQSKFKHLQYLKIHVKKIHNPSFMCEHPQCELRFVTKIKLQAHEKTHLAVKCAVCGKSFKSKQVLKTHKNKKHAEHRKTSDKKVWTCTLCHRTYKSDRGLRSHKLHHIVTSVELEDAGDLQVTVLEDMVVNNGKDTVKATNMISEVDEEDIQEDMVVDNVLDLESVIYVY